MSGSIKISQKHGVNPSVSLCFWCEEGKELLLFGRLPNDKEAPREAVYNYEPCEKCRAVFVQGIVFIAVSDKPLAEGQKEISAGHYPTGQFSVVRREPADKMLADWIPQHREGVMKRGAAYVSVEAYTKLFGHLGDVPRPIDSPSSSPDSHK